MADFEKIKKLRRRSISVGQNVNFKELEALGDSIIIGHNTWKGLKTRTGLMLVEPIYDDIKVVPNSGCCILKLQNTLFLFDMSQGRMLEMDMPLTKYKVNDTSTIELETENGKGLYSCMKHKLLVPAEYAEVTQSDAIRYLWVRTHEGNLAFYDTVEQRLIRCPDETTLCLETTDDIMWVKVGQTVHAINSSGIFDKSIMRKFALARQGRMRLYNHNYNETVITDVYGHIIN